MRTGPSGLFSGRGVLTVASAVVVGLVLLVAAAVGASGEATIEDEIAWLNLGVLGVIVAGGAELLWLLTGRRRVSLLRDHVVVLYGGTAPTPASAAVVAATPGGRVTVAGSTWHHEPSCPLATGKAQVAVGAEHRLEPCSVCGG